jgi:hypothetical protein
MPSKDSVACGGCGAPLSEATDTPVEKRVPCPKCGSTARHFSLHLVDEVKPLALVDVKKKSPGFRSKDKLRFHLQKGDQLNNATGRWVVKERIIDKEKTPAVYLESVIDGETGEVIHYDEEPLKDHLGHGSDKGRKKP